jgi:Cu(I)/Ag(I) efflux system membrane fusion protein
MKQFLMALIVATAFFAGVFIDKSFLTQESSGSAAGSKSPLYWVAPMDPDYRRDKPGKSPMGMDLVPVYEESVVKDRPGSEVHISPAVENNLGVKTAVVQYSELSGDVSTVGYIQFDEGRLHHVHLRVDGWIEELNVSAEGEPVKKGQQLFQLYSPTLHNAQKDLLSALRFGGVELIDSAKSRLRLFGLTDGQIKQVIKKGEASEYMAFYAQQDGVISELNVRHGMYVEPATEVMAIGSLATVWVIAEVFERQAAWLQEGQPVSMTVDSYPGHQWRAVVDYIYPVLDPVTRTIRVRVRIENLDSRLRPNMFANLQIETRLEKTVLNIPRDAVIRGRGSQRVVKALGKGRYQSTVVEVGREVGDRVEVLSGLNAQERVVTSAQFLIDSESSIQAEFSRMEVPGPAADEKSEHHYHHHGMEGE